MRKPNRDKNLLLQVSSTLLNEKLKGNPLITTIQACKLNNHEKIEGPLNGPKEMFTKVYDQIKQAKSEVLISLYKYQEGSDGAQKIWEALEELSNNKENLEPVEIKIIINKKAGPATLISGGGRKADISMEKANHLRKNGLNITIAEHKHYFTASNHAKTIIIDKNIGFVLTGDPSFKNSFNEQSWVELGTKITGNIAEAMRSHFITMWDQPNVIPKTGEKTPLIDTYTYTEPKMNKSDDGVIYLGKAPSADIRRKYNSPYKIALLEMLKHAQKNISLMCNNINDPDILKELAKCAEKKIKVDIILGRYHGESAESLPFAGGTNLASMQKLHAMTNNSTNLDIRWACDNEKYLVQNMEPETIHAKLVIIDGKYVLTGSSLPDKQSCHHSRESDVLIQSSSVANDYKKKFFLPIFNKGRSSNTPIKIETTRSSIEKLIKENSSSTSQTTQIESLINKYITMREAEDNYLSPRGVLSIFSNQSTYDRSHKIAVAKRLLKNKGDVSSINLSDEETKAIGDGLLNKILRATPNF